MKYLKFIKLHNFHDTAKKYWVNEFRKNIFSSKGKPNLMCIEIELSIFTNYYGMRKIFLLLYIAVFISSCCTDESLETARYELTQTEQKLIPYQSSSSVNFIHSNGYSFDFKVVEDTMQWLQYHEFCEWNCCGQDYYSYQQKTVRMESDYPRIKISFNLNTSFENYTPRYLGITINNYYFNLPYDSAANFLIEDYYKLVQYDSLMLNNRMFYNVVSQESVSSYSFEDSTLLRPETLFYNNLGLLQIKMSNDETFTFNN